MSDPLTTLSDALVARVVASAVGRIGPLRLLRGGVSFALPATIAERPVA